MYKMANEPSDLAPLPTMPYNERPTEMPLDVEECRTALWRCDGNISKAAILLKVPSARLRKFVANSAYLQREMQEATETLIDTAVDVVRTALEDDTNTSRQDTMARFVLNSAMAKSRGFSSASNGARLTLNNQGGGAISIAWADGTRIGPKVIEGEINE